MKRTVFLVCGLLLLVVNTAEARRARNYGYNYSQPVYTAPAATAAASTAKPAQPAKAAPATEATAETKTVKATPVSYSSSPTKPAVTTNAFDTRTAQGVANIMASRGVVGHFGGNPGYEGCGMAGTKEGAYSICCYANSGMATVDVGYAQGANGMWYCCRRYR